MSNIFTTNIGVTGQCTSNLYSHGGGNSYDNVGDTNDEGNGCVIIEWIV